MVLLIGVLSYRGWTAFGRHTDQLQISQRVALETDALLSALKDAESGQRGFLLTGEESYLEPYRQARADIPPLLKSLQTVTEPRPDQHQRIEDLAILIEEKLEELAQTIRLRRSSGLDAALAVVRTDRGKISMDQAREICSEIKNVATLRLAAYSEDARSSGNKSGLVSMLGATGIFVLLLVATFTIQNGIARRESLIGELREGEKHLEAAVVRAEAANLAKSTFLSTMSHEIRTPMNAILGYAQLMRRDSSLGADAQANLEIIGRSGEHLLTLINDVLDMSRIEVGRAELTPVTFNFPSLLKDLETTFRPRAEAKALGFQVLLAGESASYLVADEAKVRQALVNLLGNAIKFTRKGQITVHATVDQRSTGFWLSARIEDTGLGMTDEEQGRLFEPFSQGKGEPNTQDGTGLGLAISRKYARLMGGDLTVASNPAKGSVFRFEIPVGLGISGVAIKRKPARRVIRIRSSLPGPSVLVVDDQIENRDWLMKLLAAIGFSVWSAENGEAAIRTWDDARPRLILMDVHMPVMDGLEATRRIKADPRGKETVIVALTASALEEDRRSVFQAGADDFLSKPCVEDELLEKLRTHLDVAYDYETAPGSQSLPAPALGPLSLELAEQIRRATMAGDKKLLNKLILQVRETEGASADVLQDLADRYEYDALTRLLDEARR